MRAAILNTWYKIGGPPGVRNDTRCGYANASERGYPTAPSAISAPSAANPRGNEKPYTSVSTAAGFPT